MKQFLKKYELSFFFLLTYVLSWWSVPVLDGALIPQGPFFAALIIIALTMGILGLREYWQRLNNWRAGWWYVIGPAIIVAYIGIAFAINLLLGATPTSLPKISAGVFVMLLLFGGHWEEPGWTGYALPKLQERFGGLTAALVLGIFRAIWHLPLYLQGKLFWFDIFIFSFAMQIIIAWLYERSGKSVPAVMVFHFASNLLF